MNNTPLRNKRNLSFLTIYYTISGSQKRIRGSGKFGVTPDESIGDTGRAGAFRLDKDARISYHISYRLDERGTRADGNYSRYDGRTT
ncbi:hypothetical protein YDYSY3_35810 [Paenibacillus chitinolyticus]|nr:hypothetical protein YDYSY3_35810 [Paenibacillus chitinolyticus]